MDNRRKLPRIMGIKRAGFFAHNTPDIKEPLNNRLHSCDSPAGGPAPPNDYQYDSDRYCRRAGNRRQRDLFVLIDLDMHRSQVDDIPARGIGNAAINETHHAEHDENYSDYGSDIHTCSFFNIDRIISLADRKLP